MIGQGPDPLTGSQLIVVALTLPNSGLGLSQEGMTPGGIARLPAVIVPPAVVLVVPVPDMIAPVGTLARPKLLLKARNDSQFTDSYIKPTPPLTTVLPLPVTSQAKPKRGPKLVRLGL